MIIRSHFINVVQLRQEAAALREDLLKNYGDVVPRMKKLQKLQENIFELDLHRLSKHAKEGSQEFEVLEMFQKEELVDEEKLKHFYEGHHIVEANDLLEYRLFQRDFNLFKEEAWGYVKQLSTAVSELEFEGGAPREITNLTKMLTSGNDTLAKISRLRDYLDWMVRSASKLVSNDASKTEMSYFYCQQLDAIYMLRFGFALPADIRNQWR